MRSPQFSSRPGDKGFLADCSKPLDINKGVLVLLVSVVWESSDVKSLLSSWESVKHKMKHLITVLTLLHQTSSI